jgi:hypothetical protein
MRLLPLLLLSVAVLAGQTSAQSQGAGALPAVRHLVYRFGYNTKVADSGKGTGSTTIDISGPASDGGLIVNATDQWWNTVRPRQTSVCEVHPDGGVNCKEAPHALSPIQLVIVPLLAQNYFTALSGGLHTSWKQAYKVRATFLPAAGSGFAGQLYTWNCNYSLDGKGTLPNHAPLILVRAEGGMKQEGGRYIAVNQKANIVVDPKLKMPVIVAEELSFVPQLSVSRYTVDLKLESP